MDTSDPTKNNTGLIAIVQCFLYLWTTDLRPYESRMLTDKQNILYTHIANYDWIIYNQVYKSLGRHDNIKQREEQCQLLLLQSVAQKLHHVEE